MPGRSRRSAQSPRCRRRRERRPGRRHDGTPLGCRPWRSRPGADAPPCGGGRGSGHPDRLLHAAAPGRQDREHSRRGPPPRFRRRSCRRGARKRHHAVAPRRGSRFGRAGHDARAAGRRPRRARSGVGPNAPDLRGFHESRKRHSGAAGRRSGPGHHHSGRGSANALRAGPAGRTAPQRIGGRADRRITRTHTRRVSDSGSAPRARRVRGGAARAR